MTDIEHVQNAWALKNMSVVGAWLKDLAKQRATEQGTLITRIKEELARETGKSTGWIDLVFSGTTKGSSQYRQIAYALLDEQAPEFFAFDAGQAQTTQEVATPTTEENPILEEIRGLPGGRLLRKTKRVIYGAALQSLGTTLPDLADVLSGEPREAGPYKEYLAAWDQTHHQPPGPQEPDASAQTEDTLEYWLEVAPDKHVTKSLRKGLGAQLRLMRNERGWTNKELAQNSGRSYSQVIATLAGNAGTAVGYQALWRALSFEREELPNEPADGPTPHEAEPVAQEATTHALMGYDPGVNVPKEHRAALVDELKTRLQDLHLTQAELGALAGRSKTQIKSVFRKKAASASAYQVLFQALDAHESHRSSRGDQAPNETTTQGELEASPTSEPPTSLDQMLEMFQSFQRSQDRVLALVQTLSDRLGKLEHVAGVTQTPSTDLESRLDALEARLLGPLERLGDGLSQLMEDKEASRAKGPAQETTPSYAPAHEETFVEQVLCLSGGDVLQFLSNGEVLAVNNQGETFSATHLYGLPEDDVLAKLKKYRPHRGGRRS